MHTYIYIYVYIYIYIRMYVCIFSLKLKARDAIAVEFWNAIVNWNIADESRFTELRGVFIRFPKLKYSLYLLYWYKSANSDAEVACGDLLEPMLCCVC